jgi:hypothetical protein
MSPSEALRSDAIPSNPNVGYAEIFAVDLSVRFWPRLCENAGAPFSCVNFSHVDAIPATYRIEFAC